MADPFEQYDQYRSQYETLGGQLPSEEDEARQRVRTAAYRRLNQRGFGPMAMAGARETVSGMPVISAIPGVREFAEPSSMTQEGQDLSDFRSGSPGAATVFNVAGRTLPYAALGGAVPQLMRTGTRAAFTMGAGQGADAALHGENPAPAALSGAIGGMIGAQPIKIVTPRTYGAAMRGRARFDASIGERMVPINERAADTNVGALGKILKGDSPTDNITARHEAATRRLEQEVRDAANPPLRVPELQDPFYRDTVTGGLLGTGLGVLTQTHPALGAAIGGFVAPHVGKFMRRRINETFQEFNKRMENSAAGRAFRARMRNYINNTAVGDRNRSMINALVGSGISRQLDEFGQPPATLGGN